MWIFDLLHHHYVLQFDVQKLVYALEGSAYAHVVFELDRDLVVYECFEEAAQREG
jgi:hypothetical protein